MAKPKQPKAERAPAEEPLEGEEEQVRARPFWSGTISFGLVTIPVDLYSATRTTRTSLRMLAPDGTPVIRRYFDERGESIDAGAIERGHELENGDFVVVTDEELESLAPEQSRDIDLTRFVDRDTIPPLFFERAYILAPSGNSNLAYRLLASTLERTRRAGIASFVMRGKQYIVAIVSENGLLRAETLRFAKELRNPQGIGLPVQREVGADEVRTFRAAMHKLQGGAVSPRELSDEYWKRLEALAAKKQKHAEDVVRPEPVEQAQENLAQVIDLVAVLRKSLIQANEGNNDTARTRRRTSRKRVPVAKKISKTTQPVRKVAARESRRNTQSTKAKTRRAS